MKAWFLLLPVVWFALAGATIGIAAGIAIGLLSFIFAASAYLLADRFRIPAAGPMAGGFALIGPFIFSAAYGIAFGPDEYTATVAIPPTSLATQ